MFIEMSHKASVNKMYFYKIGFNNFKVNLNVRRPAAVEIILRENSLNMCENRRLHCE